MKNEMTAARLSAKLDRLWVPSEIFLFVLVGAFAIEATYKKFLERE